MNITYEIQWFIHNGWYMLEEKQTESAAISALEDYRKNYAITAFRVIRKEEMDW